MSVNEENMILSVSLIAVYLFKEAFTEKFTGTRISKFCPHNSKNTQRFYINPVISSEFDIEI